MPLASFVLSALLFVNAPCPVTSASAPLFSPPLGFGIRDSGSALAPEPEPSSFWFGTPELWTELPASGQRARRDKIFWWYPGYNGADEPRPNLADSIKPFGTGVATFVDAPATNAFFGGAWSMLTTLEFQSAGCWEVTGSYQGRALTFVTAVR